MNDTAPAVHPLADVRERLDAIDQQLLELLQARNRIIGEVIAAKIERQLPIFDGAREDEKIARFRSEAAARDLDPDWAEDFLRMVMSSSRARQSRGRFPRPPGPPRRVLLVGGAGAMGTLYRSHFERSGHPVRVLERGDWLHVQALAADVDLAIVCVPIGHTPEVIRRLAPHLPAQAVLADFTSTKRGILECMLAAHPGPVLSLHPMHGPDTTLGRQLMLYCAARDAAAGAWLIEQCRLWGMRTAAVVADDHDRVMHQIQGLRHFGTLLHGAFLRHSGLQPDALLQYSSPVYRMELAMTARMFAQDARMYADIVLADAERRQLLQDYLALQQGFARMVADNDREAFVREFREIAAFFGDYAARARQESAYLVERLSERFA